MASRLASAVRTGLACTATVRLPLRHVRIMTSRVAAAPKPFVPRAVGRRFIDGMTSQDLRACIQEAHPEPLLLTRRDSWQPAKTVIDMLLEDPQAEQSIVDLEVGRYDQPESFEKVQLPLAAYLEWLKSGRESGRLQGKQVYLAQWRALEELPSLKHHLNPPPFLQELLDNEIIDLYQASFFVGPAGAVTPLHFDPYFNLFSLPSTSGADAAKHFLILPASNAVNQAVKPSPGAGQPNTSPVEFVLARSDASGSSTTTHEEDLKVQMTADSPAQGCVDDLRKAAFGVTLKAGEMLLLPQRWWHRVENVGPPSSWTAGVGYWFRKRA